MDLVAELDAKAWASTRHKVQSRTPARREDHVCYRAAREIEALRKIENAPAAERGWRIFWKGFSDFLRLGHDQRTYSWHDLMDACNRGMEAVNQTKQ